MVRVTVVPVRDFDLYRGLVKKERALRRDGRGTLHQDRKYRDGSRKWVHSSYDGWIRFQNAVGQVLVAEVNSHGNGNEWQILQSFVGFLHRHFRYEITSITLSYSEGDT